MELLKLSFIISLITMGIFTITQKGMIFYFLRKPFDKASKKLNDIINARTGTGGGILSLIRSINHMKESGEYSQTAISLKEDNLKYLISKGDESTTKLKVITTIGKPILLCPPCMASVHTLAWFFILEHDLHVLMIIPVALIGSFFNSFLNRLTSKLK